MPNAVETARAGRETTLAELRELLAIPSISTLPEHAGDVRRAADWLAARLGALGADEVALLPTGGHPIVYGEWLKAPGKPTVLVYGHYDVQPADPLDEWDHPPFAGEAEGPYLYARGASDMKGQLFALLKALECLAAQGPFPVNLKFLFEGEEEIGSPSLDAFLENNRERVACDFVLNCDGGILGAEKPSITYSLRGLAYFEVHVHGPKKDLHSGLFGGVVHNPAQALCELIAGMHDAEGRATLPGFYDAVRPLSDDERQALAALGRDDAEFQTAAGVSGLWGEAGYTAVERVGARPTLEVNGILSGFTGEGSKTVLPAKAMAKISCRLVADQDHRQVGDQLRAYFKAHAPATVRVEVKDLAGGPPGFTDRDGPWMAAAAGALEDIFGKAPLFSREGGSIPIVGLMKSLLNVDSVLLGFSLPDDGIHGPNERLHIETFHRGVETYIRFLERLA